MYEVFVVMTQVQVYVPGAKGMKTDKAYITEKGQDRNMSDSDIVYSIMFSIMEYSTRSYMSEILCFGQDKI